MSILHHFVAETNLDLQLTQHPLWVLLKNWYGHQQSPFYDSQKASRYQTHRSRRHG